ncbi:MAG: hypothetical protein PHN40_08290, partial [Dysgonamonadaceae bacterium]|nr:hypothetical protein [Dysgonamonadaceae bacterium]
NVFITYFDQDAIVFFYYHHSFANIVLGELLLLSQCYFLCSTGLFNDKVTFKMCKVVIKQSRNRLTIVIYGNNKVLKQHRNRYTMNSAI